MGSIHEIKSATKSRDTAPLRQQAKTLVSPYLWSRQLWPASDGQPIEAVVLNEPLHGEVVARGQRQVRLLRPEAWQTQQKKLYTVKKEKKFSGDSEILHEIVRDTRQK